MANPKAVKVELTNGTYNAGTSFGLNVRTAAGDRMLRDWVEIPMNMCPFADGFATIPIPEDFFEVGQADMSVQLAVREDNGGGAGGFILSPLFDVIWEVPASSLISAALIF